MLRGTAVVGEALVDLVDGGDAHPGGSPLNVAVGLARLGEPAILHTRIGRDPHGDLIRTHLAASGVELGDASLAEGETWTATATVDDDGRASYTFDLGGTIAVPPLQGLQLVHTGSIGALRAEEAEAVRAAFHDTDPGTLRSFDPNIRADVMGEGARERTGALARECHVVKLSDEDALWLHPGEELREILPQLAARGVRFAVVTRGGDGCLALVDGAWYERPARAVLVADTIGAGDAFMSGLLFALLRDGTDRLLVAGEPVPPALVEAALDTALASASITVSRSGANPPRSSELSAVLD
ncbi:PfkB family carbohydrate kinase [Microbacterium sp. ASV81]|uniref:PfkB family carbohydrate kinase n=1 Tax=Microbacterium capsulatum TaxID=3041921 RepID=A0ABU0XCM9_9MICO|nr:PfkB family carbohydrate kinase [Microbacterium sp. ASV81]MDQ4212864.1 PfkB family carbohydrate kinase [Microbacterium sp. ASV81]